MRKTLLAVLITIVLCAAQQLSVLASLSNITYNADGSIQVTGTGAPGESFLVGVYDPTGDVLAIGNAIVNASGNFDITIIAGIQQSNDNTTYEVRAYSQDNPSAAPDIGSFNVSGISGSSGDGNRSHNMTDDNSSDFEASVSAAQTDNQTDANSVESSSPNHDTSSALDAGGIGDYSSEVQGSVSDNYSSEVQGSVSDNYSSEVEGSASENYEAAYSSGTQDYLDVGEFIGNLHIPEDIYYETVSMGIGGYENSVSFGRVPQTGIPDYKGIIAAMGGSLLITTALLVCVVRTVIDRRNNG